MVSNAKLARSRGVPFINCPASLVSDENPFVICNDTNEESELREERP